MIGQMVSAWVITMPGAGLLGGAAWAISDIFSPNVGAAVIVALAAVAAFTLWTLAQRNKITAADLDRTNVSVVDEAEAGRRSRRDRDDLSATMTVLASPLIDWSALGKIVAAAFIGSVGVVLLFGVLLFGVKHANGAKSSAANAPGSTA